MQDRENFDLVDKQYQIEREAHRQEIRTEIDLRFANKQYSGHSELDQKAREQVQREREKMFNQRMKEIEQQLDQIHFPDRGRKTELEILEKKERRLKAINDRLKEKNRNPDEGRNP